MPSERARKLILLNTSIGAFISPFTSSAISFATPQIGEAFGATFYQIVWVPLSFLIALSSFYLISGRISDEFGRVKFYRAGLILYSLGMILSILSNSVYMLISLLFISGIGAAMAGSNSTAIISEAYPKERRGGALGINVMSVYLGLTLAPVLGGVITHFFEWRYLLIITVPVAVLATILTYFSMGKMNIPSRKGRVDLKGGVAFASGLFLIVYYLTAGDFYGWFKEIYFLLAGLMLMGIFAYIERKTDNPLIDGRIFLHNRTFTASNVTAFLNYLSTFSIVFIFSLYLQLVLGYNSLIAGTLLISEPILMVIFAPISGLLSDKYGSRIVSSLGMAIIGASFFYLYFFPVSTVVSIVVPLGVIGMGFGLFSAANTNSVMGSVRALQFGFASGTLGTMRFVGQLLSIAVSSLLLAESLPRNVIIGMFSGITFNSLSAYSGTFIHGFKVVMIVSGIISFLGSYTSLLKNRGE